MSYPISHKLEKWILIILLAFAMAAFMGFKLLENSDLAFTLTDPSVSNSSNSLSSDQEFKSEFKKNRLEARALMADHQASVKPMPKYGKRAKKFYAKSTKKSLKKIAKSSNKKKLAKSSRKKTLARR